jgi:hypothetical protein
MVMFFDLEICQSDLDDYIYIRYYFIDIRDII